MCVCNSLDNLGARSLYSASRPKSTELINWLHTMHIHQMKRRANSFRVLPTFCSYVFPLKFKPKMLSRPVKCLKKVHS